MNEIAGKNKIDPDAIRARVAQLMQVRSLTQNTIAREANVSTGALSKFLAARYEGDNEVVASKLNAWLANVSERDSMPAALAQQHDFVDTVVTRKIVGILKYAQAMPDFAIVIGEPGVGKTITMQNYRQARSSVWVATMSADTAGQVPMLEELGYALGLHIAGGAAKMRRQIVGRVRGTGGLIMIDEAQHLDFKAIEALRGIYDASGIGMVLCGNPRLMVKVGQLPQVNSRVGRKVVLRKVDHEDVVKLAKQWDVATRDELNFLHTISQHPGGMRCVVKTLRLATLAADADGGKVDMRHLSLAWSELALEEAA